MLGKGVKRKLEQEDEGDVNGMSLCQEMSVTCYRLQRQTVFNLSLLKLHSRPGHVEPRLARRVLISNTLRHIQDELRVEGAGSPLGAAEGCFMERPVGCGLESHSEDGLTPVSRLEEDRHLFLCLEPSITKDSFTSALAEIEDLCPTVGITTLFSTSDENGDIINSADESRRADSDLSEMQSKVDSTHSSLIADFSLDDFLLSEIDNFLLDNKTLSGNGSGGMSQSALASNQTFKLELNELDHIIEVLVGS